jgi:pilus assembly protein FimV
MRATSIFTLSLVAAALALPGAAQALGLGKLTVDSALGQPLSARIELTSAARDEIDSLTARVAAPALYSQNNLNYQAALARARVTVETGADGQSYLRVSSPASVLEPYLDLLIEVDWSSGRVVRDYTLLLDPPGTGTQMAEPVAPVRGSATTRGARTTAAPTGTAAAPSAPAAAPGEGYTVKRGDTLAKIAGETKPADVTLDQMLVALFKANSDAFVGNNMNRLRAGAILTVPSADDVNAATPTDAQKEVRVQASDWRAYRDRLAAAAPEAGGESTRTAAGSIGTAVDEKTPAAQPGRDQLRVSKDAKGKGSAAEDAVATDQQLKEAQSRVAQLEKMLADSQHAIDIKNSTLAQTQAQAAAAKGTPPAAAAAPAPGVAPVPAPATPAATAPAAVTPAPSTPPAAAPSTTPATPVAPTDATPPAPTPAPLATTLPADATKPADATPPPVLDADKAAADAAKAAAAKAAVKPAPKPAPKPEPSLVDQITDGIPLWALAGAAFLILALIAIMVAQRRRKTTKFEDSIISGTDIKTNTVFGSTGGGVVNTGDNSLASDFSREGLGNIDTDEVDPIAEAEVYLAYGRDAQAEEILKDALKKDPQRQEIYLKLLEIHAQHNKPSAFETVAAELYAQCQGQGETWQKAVALGRQLDPNNPMFAEGSSTAAAHAAAGTAPDAELFTMGPDLTLPPKDMGGSGSINLDDEITLAPPPKPKTPVDILAGADRALEMSTRQTADMVQTTTRTTTAAIAGTAAAGAAAAAAAGQSVADKIEAARAKMDLDFHLDDQDKPTPVRQAARAEPALATAGASTASDRLARPAAAMELDKLDLSFDPDKATFEDPTPSVLDGQWHDAATKLDLAKAYQEMGDVEGAREILQEVLHEGDDQQKTEAQALIAKLG